MNDCPVSKTLWDIYQRLLDCYGPQDWWPAEEPFEVIVGAILTQSAAWRNVEKAIANLKGAEALSPQVLRSLSVAELAALIRPCGYYNTKTRKLKALVTWLGEYYHDNLDKLFDNGTGQLREQLLSVYGIGPETADAIILYAAQKPIFVIDAYTHRIISRIGLVAGSNNYTIYQSLFMDNLSADVNLFNEYHALLVCLGKDVCRSRPHCNQCCLGKLCRYGQDI